MVTLDFHGFAMTPKYQEKKEAHAKLKPVKALLAKHLLYGIRRQKSLEMADASCMVVFQLARGLILIKNYP